MAMATATATAEATSPEMNEVSRFAPAKRRPVAYRKIRATSEWMPLVNS